MANNTVSSPAASVLEKVNVPNPNPVRPIAQFPPDIWGDRFLNYTFEDMRHDQARTEKQVEELKEIIRKEIFVSNAHVTSHKLKLIDAVQRLGLAYHFERETQVALQDIYKNDHNDEEDLYTTSLYFRLLRQHGFDVSCDIFTKFKEGQGTFKQCLVDDTVGMLSLYEATHLKCHGEDILEEALVFTTTHLESMVNNSNKNPLAGQIKCALKRPLRKSLERVHARYYISVYQNEESHNISLLQLAKLDFNLLQSQHKKELSEISKWWKELDVGRKLPFARDRIVELYFWILGVYFEPKYQLARNILTKCIAILSIMDDIYDAFGTFEELTVLTEAIERWDINLIGQVPEYLQNYYEVLLNLFDEFEEELAKENQSYRLFYAKEAIKCQARFYFEEARWRGREEIPSMEEYLRVSLPSSGYSSISFLSLIGMLDEDIINIITKEMFESILFQDSKIIRASCIIARFMDDTVSHKFEQEREHIRSGIECYMTQYGVTEKEVKQVFKKKVENAWKDINEEMLQRTTELPMLVKMRVLNLSRAIDILYTEDDGYTRVGKVTIDSITCLLINPVPL